MKTSRFILSTFLASATGFAIGMLFAPQKGSKTRNKISKKNTQYSDYLSGKIDQFVDSLSHPMESIEDETKRLAKKTALQAKQVASEVNSSLK